MTDFGMFTDARTVCFERLLPGTRERVWQHVTQPELLADWLGLARLEARPGGRLELHVSDAVVSGTVLVHVPPLRLACSWHASLTDQDFDGLVDIDLETHGAGTRLVLRVTAHGGRPAARVASAWHARLDALATLLVHGGPIDQAGRAEQVFPDYAALADASTLRPMSG